MNDKSKEALDRLVADITALHRTQHYDKYDQRSGVSLGFGGRCMVCGHFEGYACATVELLALNRSKEES